MVTKESLKKWSKWILNAMKSKVKEKESPPVLLFFFLISMHFKAISWFGGGIPIPGFWTTGLEK